MQKYLNRRDPHALLFKLVNVSNDKSVKKLSFSSVTADIRGIYTDHPIVILRKNGDSIVFGDSLYWT